MKYLIMLMLLMFAMPVMAQESWVAPDENVQAPLTKTEATELLKAEGSSRQQRRAMGITFRNLRLKLKEMKAAGELEGLTRPEISVMVLDRLVTDNPKAFADPSLDWDGLLAFIERLIPLILKLISLFGI